jgi:ABC-type polysaccharide/polyol phosphate transport system ATPase subunit
MHSTYKSEKKTMDDLDSGLAFKLTNCCLQYPKHHQFFLSYFFDNNRKNFYQNSLDKINLKIKKGEKIGIIGLNGAGKSTFLRLAAGIFIPTSGQIETSGNVFSIFSYGTGSDLELSGRENVYRIGLLRGFEKKSIDNQIEKIIEFCDLGEKFDEPMRTYSTGMKIRIGISMLILYQPEILVFDEGMGSGDKKFAQRAKNLISDVLHKKQATILMASHSEKFLSNFVDKGIVLHKGKLQFYGKFDEALEVYRSIREKN